MSNLPGASILSERIRGGSTIQVFIGRVLNAVCDGVAGGV